MTGPDADLTSETITTTTSVYMRSNVKGADQWKKTNYSPEDEARQAAASSGAYTAVGAFRRRDHQRRSGGDLHRSE